MLISLLSEGEVEELLAALWETLQDLIQLPKRAAGSLHPAEP